MNEETLFAAALEKKDPAERAAFLAQACGGDTALRDGVEARLRACGERADDAAPAHSPSASSRLRQLTGRLSRGGLALALMLLALLGGIVGASRWREMQHQRIKAEEQRDGAVKAAGEARESARQLHAVLAFVQDSILAAARPKGPEGGLGAEATLRAALDAAEPKVAAAFADQPLAEAEARHVLGVVYFRIGEARQAIRQWQRALDLRKAQLGASHSRTLESLNNLPEAHRLAGQLNEALPLYEEAVKVEEAHLPANHPLLLVSTNNLAVAYRDVGRLNEALPLFEKVLKLRKAQLGADHPDTLQSMNNLAAAYWSLGQLDHSVPLFEETLRGRKRKLGIDHPETLITMANLGVNYRDAGRPDDAIPLLEEAVQRAQNRPGGAPAQLAWFPLELVRAYERAGQWAEAERQHRSILEQMRAQVGGEDARSLAQLAALGANLLRQKRYAEAEPLLRDCLKIRQRKQPEDWSTFQTQSLLGGALLGQKKYAYAEPLLLQGYQGMKEREAKIPAGGKRNLSRALDQLVRLYDAWGAKDKADQWRRKGEAAKKELHDSQDK